MDKTFLPKLTFPLLLILLDCPESQVLLELYGTEKAKLVSMAQTKWYKRTYGLPVNPKIGTTIFYIAFALYTTHMLIFSTGYNDFLENASTPYFNFYYLFRLVIWGLLGLKLLLQRYNIFQLLIVAALVLLIAATWKNTGIGLGIFLFIAAGQNIKIRRLAQIALPITLIILLATVIGFFAGVIDNVQLSSDFHDNASGRNSFGFRHPNAFGSFVFAAILAWLIINYRKLERTKTSDVFMGAFTALLVLLSAVLVFKVSESETYTIAIVLAGLIYVLSLALPARLLAASGFVTTVAIASFSFYAMFTFDPQVPWWNKLDGALSHRLTLPRYYFTAFPNTLFGQDFSSTHISWFPDAEGHLVVDNAYCHMWLQYGIVAAIVFVALLLLVFAKSFRENRWNEATFGLFLAVIIGFAETTILRFDTNYPLIAISALIFGASLQSLEIARKNKLETSAISQEKSQE